jgi:hypothetical protein
MSDTAKPTTGKKTAGAFDVRVIIGALLGIYGVILLLMGLFGDPETDKTGGPNANLWAGLALAVTAAIFLAWWRLRPIVVPETEDHDELGAPPPGH